MSRARLDEFVLARGNEASDLGSLFGTTMQPVAQQFPVSGAPQAQPSQQPVAIDYPTPAGYEADRPRIIASESGGDPNALLGFANRKGGAFEGFQVADLSINDAIAFADPNGPYGQYSKTQTPDGRVATPMGPFQLVGSTIKAARDGLGLKGDEKMTPEIQEAMAKWVYANQGPQAWEGLKKGMSFGGPAGATFAQGGTPPNMADYQVPEQPESRSFFKAIKAALHGEDAPELDYKSALQSLGVGLGQLSHGHDVDTSEISNRQLYVNEQRRKEYETKRERAAAAQYAASQGDKAAADALMTGGMDLGQYFTKEQINDQRNRWAEEDAKSAAGQRALYSYGADTLGLSPSAASAFAQNPSAFVAGQSLYDAQQAVRDAKEKEHNTRTALSSYYKTQNDPDSQRLAELLDNDNIDFGLIQQSFDLSEGMKQSKRLDKADVRADKGLMLETARTGQSIQSQQQSDQMAKDRFGYDVASGEREAARADRGEVRADKADTRADLGLRLEAIRTDAGITAQQKSNELAQATFDYGMWKDKQAFDIASQAHKDIVTTLAASSDPAGKLAATYAAADKSLSVKDALDAARQPAPPAVQENYNKVVAQGYKGSLMDYQMALAKASASTTSIDMKAETKGREKMGELFAQRYDDITKSGQTASEGIALLSMMEGALADPDLHTGLGGEWLNSGRKLGVALGITDAATAASGELVSSLNKQLALKMRDPNGGTGGMPGAVSDTDRNWLASSQVGLQNTKKGNLLMIEANRRIFQRKLDVAAMADKYAVEHGVLGPEFNQQVAQYGLDHPLFSAEEKQSWLGDATGVATGKAPDFSKMSEPELDQWIADHSGAQ